MSNFNETVVIGVGGSAFTDQHGLNRQRARVLISDLVTLADWFDIRLGLLIGGGATARHNQDMLRMVLEEPSSDQLDWAGIYATQQNARYFLESSSGKGLDRHLNVITNPKDYQRVSSVAQLIFGAGFEPGCSTDFRLVQMAKALGASKLVNLTNIKWVYTADPSKDPEAKPLEDLTWDQLVDIQGEGEWEPGSHSIFDPVATSAAIEAGLTLASISYREMDSLHEFLESGDVPVGTLIHP